MSCHRGSVDQVTSLHGSNSSVCLFLVQCLREADALTLSAIQKKQFCEAPEQYS